MAKRNASRAAGDLVERHQRSAPSDLVVDGGARSGGSVLAAPEACTDDDLRAILAHNRNEEVEHAIMTLEWLRRRDPVFAENVSTYVGTSGAITETETAAVEKVVAADRGARGTAVAGGSKATSDGSFTFRVLEPKAAVSLAY